MYELSDFYAYCARNDVDVMPYRGAPQPAMTLRDGSYYCVALDFDKITDTQMLRGCTMHEYGHLKTGALHKCDSPYQLVQQAEYRAEACAARTFLPAAELAAAMRAGYTAPWQLAEYFDLPQRTIEGALHYWRDCRGVDFNRLASARPSARG